MEGLPSTTIISKVTISLCIREKRFPIPVWLVIQLKLGLKMKE